MAKFSSNYYVRGKFRNNDIKVKYRSIKLYGLNLGRLLCLKIILALNMFLNILKHCGHVI